MLALLAAGRGDQADSLCDALIARKPHEEDWDSIFVTFSRDAGPAVTSRIVARVVPRARLTAGERARLYLSDGVRLLAFRDPARADQRFLQAGKAAPDSAEADKAEVARIWARVAQTGSMDSIPAFTAALVPYAAHGGGVSDARHLQGILTQLNGPDTTVIGAFRAGEIARDSLYADPLAASLLLGFARRHPSSVFAAKAIVAAMPLSPEHADSLSHELEARYAASPYSLALRGAPSPGYDVAEDSLARLFGGPARHDRRRDGSPTVRDLGGPADGEARSTPRAPGGRRRAAASGPAERERAGAARRHRRLAPVKPLWGATFQNGPALPRGPRGSAVRSTGWWTWTRSAVS